MLLEEIGGRRARAAARIKAVQTGGPSGGCLPARLFDLPIDYERMKAAGSIMGSGGMVVLDETDVHGRCGALLPGVHQRRVVRQMHRLPRGHPRTWQRS